MEPTLKDIERPAIDPVLGGEEPSVLNDSSETLKLINQNAQFKANNDWRKYQQFLSNYEDRIKNINDISSKEISDADRPYFKERTVDLLKGALKDPYAIYSPEFNQKLSSLTQDATSSKMKADYDKANRLFLAQHPEWITDENSAMVTDLIQNQTLDKGGWKPYQLKPPTPVMDRMKYFEGLMDNPSVKELVNANRIDNEAGVTYERQDTKYNRQKYLDMVKLGYDENPQIQKIAQAEFSKLNPEMQQQLQTPENYWLSYGAKHFGSEADILRQGKEVIQGLPNFLKKAEFENLKRQQAEDNFIDREQLKISKQNADNKGNPQPSSPVSIDYWSERILPQVSDVTKFNKKDTKSWFFKNDINNPSNYTGDIKISSTDLAGLDVATFGETNEKDKPLSINKNSEIKVKYENGKPVGISVDGKYFDSKTINRKAYQMHDKYMSGRSDVSPFAEIIESKNATQQTGQNNSVGESEKERLRKLYGIK